ncbi:MAG: hypothetical protein KF819_01055 [Labilithrix sp.]|nr:hypothetical protein [Labilithrix sp.]
MRIAPFIEGKRAIALGAIAATVASLLACGGQLDRVGTTTTSAASPRPDATGTTTRTIDNAGFVDNGGRTSDMTSRTEASGMRGTEAGSERITGTPGSGLPIPFLRPPPREGTGELSTTTRSAAQTPAEAVARIARARCDFEIACRHAPAADCMAQERRRTGAELSAMSCPDGITPARLGVCLSALRRKPCSERNALDAVAECREQALCAP